MNDELKDCTQCKYHKGMSNPAKGVKIPGEYGKCIRPEGHCSPNKVNKGFGNAGEKEMNELKNIEHNPGSLLCNIFADKELNTIEQERLVELENTIFKNFQAFYVVGCALAEIQVNRLYRQTHDTFEEYCRERFEIARSTAYQYLKGAEVVDNVRSCGQIGQAPANEAQVRPLVKLSPENQVKVWIEVLDTAPEGHVTAKHVSKVVRQFLGEQVRERRKRSKMKKIRHRSWCPGNSGRRTGCWWMWCVRR